MALDPFVQALTEHWDSVDAALSDSDRGRLRELAGRFAAADAGSIEQLDRAQDLADLLSVALPRTHPVRDAISRGIRYGRGGGAPDWPALTTSIQLRLAAFGGPGPAAPEPTARLLAEPALTEDQLRARGCDPAQANLIRLTGPSGTRFPAFQFGADGRPLRLVLAVNAVLDAEDDPWGVADWWLGRNAWLDAKPADLLGRSSGEHLLSAARSLADEED